jgi:amino acid adenylation domain-containing protein
MLLDQLVSAAAQRFPDRHALVSGDAHLTYRELDLLTSQVAAALLEGGLEPGERVGLFMEKSIRAVAILLGTLRAGGVYVPIDPQSPPRRAALIVRESAVQVLALSPSKGKAWEQLEDAPPVPCVLLTGEPVRPVRGASRVLSWDDVASRAAAGPLRPRGGDPNEAAYILFTSGSTGVPKGVVLSHNNALAFISGAADLVGLSAGDKVLGLAPFHFDLSVFDLYATFDRGAELLLAPEWALLTPDKLIDLIQEAGISVVYSVPSIFQLLMKTRRLTAAHLPSLRTLIYAGEPFPIRALRDLKASFPQARFFNFYGPTETNVCLYYPLHSVPSDDEGEVPIGWPCCGAQVILRGEGGRPVGVGEEGELLVDGPTVMLGYWKDGKVQAASRPYATGDRAVLRKDGAILFRGRGDHQVKVQGVRVELGEVEAALCKHHAIREAVVVAVDHHLAALVVSADPDLSVLAVKRHCAEQLARGMTPRDIHLVDALPRRSNGKVDRQRVECELRQGLVGASEGAKGVQA